MKTIEQLQRENEVLIEIMEHNQQTIAIMWRDLFFLGVNFDFDKVPERHAALTLQMETEE